MMLDWITANWAALAAVAISLLSLILTIGHHRELRRLRSAKLLVRHRHGFMVRDGRDLLFIQVANPRTHAASIQHLKLEVRGGRSFQPISGWRGPDLPCSLPPQEMREFHLDVAALRDAAYDAGFVGSVKIRPAAEDGLGEFHRGDWLKIALADERPDAPG